MFRGFATRTGMLMLAGAVVVTLGLACVGTSYPSVGGALLLGGWLVLGASVHGFGRAEDDGQR